MDKRAPNQNASRSKREFRTLKERFNPPTKAMGFSPNKSIELVVYRPAMQRIAMDQRSKMWRAFIKGTDPNAVLKRA